MKLNKRHTFSLTAYLRQQGYRPTPQRKVIFNVLCALGGQATAAQIYRRVRASMPTINRATIYRSLSLFDKLGIIAPTELVGQTLYRLTVLPLTQCLLCKRCGQLESVSDVCLQKFSTSLLAECGFQVDVSTLVIQGHCTHCS